MDNRYKEYMLGKWKEAELCAIKIGSTSNEVVVAFFKMMCQPYYFWNKIEK